MATTALFIEILLGGTQTLTWMLVASTIFCGTKPLEFVFLNHSPQSGILFLLTAYSLGVVFDRVWDGLFKKVDRRIRKTVFHNDNQIDEIRIKMFHDEKIKTDFIEYIRNRMRIARSMVCNFFILAIVSIIAYIVNIEQFTVTLMLSVITIELIVLATSFYAYLNISKSYYKTLAKIREFCQKK